jgi:hypothetical protein
MLPLPRREAGMSIGLLSFELKLTKNTELRPQAAEWEEVECDDLLKSGVKY